MPDLNGRELYQQVRDTYPDIKVLYMSGYTDNVVAHHGILESDVHYLQKPFSTMALAVKIRKALDQKPEVI